jgi:hypothetical protein
MHYAYGVDVQPKQGVKGSHKDENTNRSTSSNTEAPNYYTSRSEKVLLASPYLENTGSKLFDVLWHLGQISRVHFAVHLANLITGHYSCSREIYESVASRVSAHSYDC